MLWSMVTDAMLAYSTDEPFVLYNLGAPYLTFSPRARTGSIFTVIPYAPPRAR
jgi:hypothetical protein